MGGDSESSNTTNQTNTSGTASANGANNGAQISGVNNSDISVDVEVTDHGAIDGSFDFAGDVVDELGGMVDSVIDSMQDVSNNAVTSGNNLASNVVDKNNDLLENVLDNNSNLVNDVLDSNNDIYQGALDSVNSASGQIAASNKDSLAFAEKMAKEAMTDNQIQTQEQFKTIAVVGIVAVCVVFGIRAWGKK